MQNLADVARDLTDLEPTGGAIPKGADPLDIEEMHTSVATVPAKKEPTFGRSPPPPEASV